MKASIFSELRALPADDLEQVAYQVRQLQTRAFSFGLEGGAGRPAKGLPAIAPLEMPLSALPVGVLLLEPTGFIVSANADAERLLGYKCKQLAGAPIRQFIPEMPEDTMRRLPTVQLEFTVNRSDGSRFPLRIDFRPLSLTEGDFILASFFNVAEQNVTELALRDSDRNLRELAALVPQLIWTCLPNGECNYLSPQWVDYTGMTLEQQMRRQWMEHVHPADMEALLQVWMKSVEDGSDYSFEVRLRRRDGQFRWFVSRAVPLRDSDGRILKWFGSCSDVHEARATRAALRLENEKLSKLTASISGAFISFQLHPDGSISMPYASSAFTDIFGLKPEDVRSDAALLFCLINVDDRRRVETAIRESARNLTKFEQEYRFHHPQKGLIWLGALAIPERQPEGTIVWDAVVMDVSRRKEMEEALQEREERFHNLAEVMPHLVWQMTPDGDSNFVNRRFVDYAGQDMARFSHVDWVRLIHPDDVAMVRMRWAKVKASQSPESLDNLRLRIRRHDGAYRWFFNRMVAVRDAAGKLRHFLGTCTDIDDWMQTEASLRGSETRFRLLADSIPQLAWMATNEGSMIWFNQRWYDFTGCQPEDVEGWGWEEFHHPDHITRVADNMRRSWALGVPWEDSFPLRRHDGVYRWFLSRALPQLDENGLVVRWFGTHTDVTEQRQAESDQQFLLDLGAALLAAADPGEVAGIATDFLGSYLGMERCGWFSVDVSNLQYTIDREYLHGDLISHAGTHSLAQLGSDDYVAAVASGRAGVIDDASTHPETSQAYQASADAMPRAIVLIPILRDRKWVGGIGIAQSAPRAWSEREVGLIRSATKRAWSVFETAHVLKKERVKLEGLADREQRLLLSLHAAGIGTWDYNPVANTANVDGRCKLAFGFSEDGEVDYPTLIDAVHQDDQPRVRALIAAAFDPGTAAGPFSFECRTVGSHDARQRYISCKCKVFFRKEDAGLSAYRFLGVVQDITEHKLSADALRRSNSELEQFAYAAAHDLQEPMRNVGHSTQLLASRLKGTLDPDVNDFLESATQGSLRMQAMVKDLLAYARAIDGAPGSQSVSDSNEVLSIVLANLKTAIEEKKAEITWEYMQPVRMEPLHLTQLLQNLISNGLKYAKPGWQPRIHIANAPGHGECTFSVRDNGIGISPLHQTRVFGAFRRLHEIDVPGTGIGLALCKRIVEQYGGKIWIESEAGAGSTFLFTVPAIESKRDEKAMRLMPAV